VTVLSSDAKPYLQARAALDKRLAAMEHRSRTIELKDLPKDLGGLVGKTDVFVAVGSQAAVSLHKRLPASARLAFCLVADPVSLGLTGRPRTAGISTDIPPGRQFALIAEALPAARTLGMLHHSKSAKSRRILAGATGSLPPGWQLKAVDLAAHRTPADAIAALLEDGTDIVWTAPDPAVYNVATIRSLLLHAMRRKMPVFGYSVAFVRAGALLGVGVSPDAQGRQAAEAVGRLLRDPPQTQPAGSTAHGTSGPEDLAPEYQTALHLVVAHQLSITLPKGLLRRTSLVFGRGKGAAE
jgi:putative ABC transport system substrate-binding protein